MQSPSDANVFKVVLTGQIEPHGMGTITLVGKLARFDSFTLLVKCGDKYHEPAGWHFDRRDAERQAAAEVEAIAALLLAQAERLRSPAAVEAA